MGNIRGKIVIITGAATGMGRNHAIEFAERGAKVVIGDVRTSPLDETAVEMEKNGGTYLKLKCDVTLREDVEKMVEETVERFGRIDILVNNAGAFRYGPITELTEGDYNIVMDVNVKGVFLCSQAVIKQMLKQKDGGKIINISSVSGRRGDPLASLYCMSKFAVIGLTQSLAQELAEKKIYVNAVCPGIIFGTDLQEEPGGFLEADMKRTGEMDPAKMKKLKESWVPLKRAGRPEDITELVLFLASDQSNYITGQSINVDGGLVMS